MRRRFVFPAILIVIGISIFAYGGVKYLVSPKLPALASPDFREEKRVGLKRILSDEGTTFFDAAILESGKLFAVGFHASDSKVLYSSDDEGASWTKRQLPSKGFVMHGASFVQDRYGWIVGDGGLVMRTEDSGNTWQMLGQPTNYGLAEVQFVSPHVGYAGGGAEIGCQIFRTRDGGKSWDRVYRNLEGGNIFDIAVLNENTVIAPINDSFLLRTDDGGRTWSEIQLSTEGAAGVTFTPEGVGWVVGRQGSFYYSLDAGRTWQRPAALPNLVKIGDWNSIDFVDEKTGVAVGKKGAVVVTNDGGATWLEMKTDITDDLGKVRLNRTVGVVAGSRALYKLDPLDVAALSRAGK